MDASPGCARIDIGIVPEMCLIAVKTSYRKSELDRCGSQAHRILLECYGYYRGFLYNTLKVAGQTYRLVQLCCFILYLAQPHRAG